MKPLLFLSLASTVMLSACGGGSSSSGSQTPETLSGNWQFTMAPPTDGSFFGGLQGGFLIDSDGSVSGGAEYAVSLSQLLIPCSTGSAQITGSIDSNNVWTLTAVAGTQTFILSGTQSLDGSTIVGTYTSPTGGTASNGTPCGTVQTGPIAWSATLVPPMTGPVLGSFHSTGGAAGLGEQDFLLSGSLTEGPNTGASTATVTGNLSFINSLTNASDYPCFSLASVYGQISGNSVALELVGPDGSDLGLIGEPVGSNGLTGVNPVTFASTSGGAVLNGAGPSYLVATAACPGSLGNIAAGGDFGDICLALNGASACQSPITLAPSALTFAVQALNSPPTSQTITLSNTSGATLGSVTLNLTNDSGANNFAETDTCGVDGVPSLGQAVILLPGQSCAVTVTFTPLETCAAGLPPAQCPSALTATLVVASPSSEMILTVPVTGTASSAHGSAISDFNPSAGVEHHADID
ncbi:MAG: hypothetical protein ABSD75_11280 [Terriglobales bacterium]